MVDLIDEFGLYEDDPCSPVANVVIIGTAELALHLDLTSPSINRLTGEGVLTRHAFGKYDRDANRAAYIRHLRKLGIGRRVATDPTIAEHKARVAAETADKLALANARSRGEVLPVSAVRAEWLSVVTDLRARLLAVPGRVTARLSLDRPIAAALDAEVRAALADLVADAGAANGSR